VILKYPFDKGSRWTSKRGGTGLIYVIDGWATVRVRAGEFKDCLKVREIQQGIDSSWKVDYYAPGVGKVLTTLATADMERRNTELLSYNLMNVAEKYAAPPMPPGARPGLSDGAAAGRKKSAARKPKKSLWDRTKAVFSRKEDDSL
jgi:hypothetical protein